MADRAPDPTALDVLAFCRQGGGARGPAPLASMARLADSLFVAPADEMADWAAQGSVAPKTGGDPEIWLHLTGDATLQLQCQRCLQAVAQAVHVDRRFRFVQTEAQAARLDEESEDDVLVLEPRLNLLELLEDELILNLPLVPRHEICPQPLLPADGPADEPAPHPFAALAALRSKPRDGAG